MATTQNRQDRLKTKNSLPYLPQVSSRWLVLALTTLISSTMGATLSVQAQIPLELQQPTSESEIGRAHV